MKNLFEMLQAIFGKNIISKTIGTRTNVIKLPSNKSSPLKNEFDVFRSAENPAVFEKLKKVIEEEAPYISRMNDAERLIYEGNVKRLHDYLVSIGEIKPTISAEVIGLGTKEPIAGKGLASLVEEAGQTSPPGTLVGNIQSRINKLKGLGKEMEKQTGEKATLTDVLRDLGASQQSMSRLYDEGLVRATARQILINDIKAGKIKNITVSEAINMGEPLDPFRRIYGEGALEQLDSLIPNFRNLKTEMEAEKFARSKFKFEPDENRLPGSVSIEEGRKAEQEFGINKSTPEVEEPQAEIIPFKKKPEEFAKGGSVGLDYLTGQESTVERENYALGSLLKKVFSSIRGEAPSTPSTSDVSLTVLDRYKNYLSQFEKPTTSSLGSGIEGIIGRVFNSIKGGSPQEISKDDLYNLYRSGVEGKAKGGRIGFKIGGGKKILDLITGANKKSKSKITKKPTKEDYEDYAEILNDSENIVVQGTETFDELDALVKKQKDYEASMFQQYKMGKLDPVAGEKSESRMKFLRKKAEEAQMTGDRRLITSDEMDELSDLESTYLNDVDEAYGIDTAVKKEMKQAMKEGVQKTNRMIELGLDPSSSKDYDKFLEIESIKQKYGNVIDDNLLQQILVDDNPQRKAEVLASIDEAIKMQERGMGPEQIMDIIKNTTRTKQAKGGSVGLGYLMGF